MDMQEPQAIVTGQPLQEDPAREPSPEDISQETDFREDPSTLVRWKGIRFAYQAVGILALGAGFVGLFLPLVPTTIFLLIAAWAFARSSDRLHGWLYQHRQFGPLLRDWDQHGVIRPRAKISATIMIIVSFLITIWMGVPNWLLWMLALVLAAVIVYILSRPSHAPASVESKGSPV